MAVKHGSGGAELFTAEGSWRERALEVSVVDTVGEGDAFTAGFLSAVIDGEGPASRLRRGCLLGAFCVSGRGDWESLPDRRQLAQLGNGRDDLTIR